MVFNLSFMYWKMNLPTVPFVEPVHCTFRFVISFSLPSLFIAPYNILPYTNSAMSSAATFLVRRSAVSFPSIPTRAFTQLNNTVHIYTSRLSISFITFPIIMLYLFLLQCVPCHIKFSVSHYSLFCIFYLL